LGNLAALVKRFRLCRTGKRRCVTGRAAVSVNETGTLLAPPPILGQPRAAEDKKEAGVVALVVKTPALIVEAEEIHAR
jgi:hypothetical protein